MPKYNSRADWKTRSIALVELQHSALVALEHALGQLPEAEALLLSSNKALQNSADAAFVTTIARAAMDIGIIVPEPGRRFGIEHISQQLQSLAQLGKIACDVDQTAFYFHPDFQPVNPGVFKYDGEIVVGRQPAMPEQP